MKVIKVSLYVREHSSRELRKATPRESMGTIYVLRYGKKWETIDAKNWTEANVAKLRRQTELLQGWQPKPKIKTQVKTTDLKVDAAIDTYLSEIKSGRKKKTHQAYSVALKYFYESMGNKAMKEINRVDLIRFAAFLRDDKEQAQHHPRHTRKAGFDQFRRSGFSHSAQVGCNIASNASIHASQTSNIAFLKVAAGVHTLNCSRGVSVMVGCLGVIRRKSISRRGRHTAIILAPTCSRRSWLE